MAHSGIKGMGIPKSYSVRIKYFEKAIKIEDWFESKVSDLNAVLPLPVRPGRRARSVTILQFLKYFSRVHWKLKVGEIRKIEAVFRGKVNEWTPRVKRVLFSIEKIGKRYEDWFIFFKNTRRFI